MSLYLVTGGAGFIGSHIVEVLMKKGERVRILDNFSTGSHITILAAFSPAIGRLKSGQDPFLRGDSHERDTSLLSQPGHFGCKGWSQ